MYLDVRSLSTLSFDSVRPSLQQSMYLSSAMLSSVVWASTSPFFRASLSLRPAGVEKVSSINVLVSNANLPLKPSLIEFPLHIQLFESLLCSWCKLAGFI